MSYDISETPSKSRPNASLITRIPLWVIPLLVALLFFQIRGVQTSPDAAWYVALGLNLHHGLGYVESDGSPSTDRGPVFPALIAVSFWLFGESLKSALAVVRVFFVLNVILVYVMGSRLFNPITGLMASGLILTSLTIHQWSSYILLDNVLPFFILVSQFLLFMGFEDKRMLYFGLAGFVLAVAFLTKPLAYIFLPLPFLLWLLIPAYRNRKFWSGMLLFWGIWLFTLVPWIVYVYTAGGDDPVKISGGAGFAGRIVSSATSERALSSFTLSQVFNTIWSPLGRYYQRHFADKFIVAPLFLLAWGYMFFEALFKRSRAHIFLVSSLLLFSPLFFFLGQTGWRAGQSFYLYLLSFVALAGALWHIGAKFFGGSIKYIVAVVLAIGVISIQIWGGKTAFVHLLQDIEPSGLVANLRVYPPSFGQTDWAVGNWHNEWVREAGEWFERQTSPGEPILMDDYWADSLYFYLNASHPIHRIPYIASNTAEGADGHSLAPVLFAWSRNGKTDPTDPGNRLEALSESQFLAKIRELGIKYVVVTPRQNFLALYLWTNPGFKQVAQFGDGQIKIFKVPGPVAPVSFPLRVEPGLFLYIQAANRYPQLYDRLVEGYLAKTLGWPGSQLEAPKDINLEQFKFVELYRIYQLDENEPAANLTEQRGNLAAVTRWRLLAELLIGADRSKAGIMAYERASDLAPNLIWPRIRLAQLRQQDQSKQVRVEPETTIKTYKRTIELDPDNIEAYWELIEAYRISGQLEQASTVQAAIVDRWLDKATAHFYLGQLYEAQGKTEAAATEYTTAIELAPTMARAYIALGRLHQAQGRAEDSVVLYQTAARQNPTAAWPHLELGKIYLQQMPAP